MSLLDIADNESRAKTVFLARSAVVLNYNAHKSEKNKTMMLEEVQVLTLIETDSKATVLLKTARNDGLMYEVVFDVNTDRVTLFLYNRIARKVLTGETTKEDNA